jgi:hypothetical protein
MRRGEFSLGISYFVLKETEYVPFIAVNWLARVVEGAILYTFISNKEKQGVQTQFWWKKLLEHRKGKAEENFKRWQYWIEAYDLWRVTPCSSVDTCI